MSTDDEIRRREEEAARRAREELEEVISNPDIENGRTQSATASNGNSAADNGRDSDSEDAPLKGDRSGGRRPRSSSRDDKYARSDERLDFVTMYALCCGAVIFLVIFISGAVILSNTKSA